MWWSGLYGRVWASNGDYLDAVAHSWSENRVPDSVEFRYPSVTYPFASARWRRVIYSRLRALPKAVAGFFWELIERIHNY